jgi:hypothetical protein
MILVEPHTLLMIINPEAARLAGSCEGSVDKPHARARCGNSGG